MEKTAKKRATDELRYGNIGRLLLNYSIPAVASMTVASVYNIIDRIFIGQWVGPLAIAGLALTFPLMNLAIAFGSLVGSGASTMISIKLGEQQINSASRFLGNAVVINIILGILLTVLGLWFLDPILYAFGASPDTIPYARDFMKVIFYGNIFSCTFFSLNNILRAKGYPKKAMIITIGTVIINLLLAPIFIYYFQWGIKGVAWATVISQIIGAIVVVSHYFDKNNTLYFQRRFLKLKSSIIGRIFEMGMSSFVINFCASIVVVILNYSLKSYGGDLAIAAFGIINSIGGLIFMLIFGFNLGMQPIVGYNYGAKQYDRVLRTLRYGLVIGTCVSTFGFLLGEIFPWYLARAFTSHQTLIDLTMQGMRIVVITFPIIGGQIVATSFFQAVGMPKVSIFLSMSRQLLLLIPALLFLPHFFDLQGVWIALPVSDVISCLLTAAVLLYHYRNMKRKIVNKKE